MKRVRFSRPGLKDLDALGTVERKRVSDAIERYAEHSVGDVKQLRDREPPQYCLSVGKWRILFRRAPDEIKILAIDNRGEAY